MTRIRLIAIDMDGTLLGTDGQVSRRNLRALHAAHEAGITIAIATGRRHSYAMKVLRSLDLPASSILISSNGAVTRTLDARLLQRHELALDTSLWLCKHLSDYRNAMVFTFDRVGPDGEDARGALAVEDLEHLHGSIGTWMQANEPYIQHFAAMEDALTADAPIQAMLCGTVGRMRQAEKLLLEHEHVFAHGISALERIHTARVAIHRTEYPRRDLCIVDLLPAQCSKGAALLDICYRLNLPAEQTMGIGDNWNDLPMFQTAGHSVVMGNAPQQLRNLARQSGWKVGPSNEQDGVAQTVEEVLRNRPFDVL